MTGEPKLDNLTPDSSPSSTKMSHRSMADSVISVDVKLSPRKSSDCRMDGRLVLYQNTCDVTIQVIMYEHKRSIYINDQIGIPRVYANKLCRVKFISTHLWYESTALPPLVSLAVSAPALERAQLHRYL